MVQYSCVCDCGHEAGAAHSAHTLVQRKGVWCVHECDAIIITYIKFVHFDLIDYLVIS